MADYDISKINLKGNDLNFADKEARKAIESLDSTVNDIPQQLTDIKSITSQTLNAVSDTATRFNSVDSQLATLQKSIVDTNGNVLSSKEDINKQISAVRNSIADLSQTVTDDYASMLSDMTDLSNKLSQVNANVLSGNKQLSDDIGKLGYDFGPITNISGKITFEQTNGTVTDYKVNYISPLHYKIGEHLFLISYNVVSTGDFSNNKNAIIDVKYGTRTGLYLGTIPTNKYIGVTSNPIWYALDYHQTGVLFRINVISNNARFAFLVAA